MKDGHKIGTPEERVQREWFIKGLHEGKNQMKTLAQGWQTLSRAAEDRVAYLARQNQQLICALEHIASRPFISEMECSMYAQREVDGIRLAEHKRFEAEHPRPSIEEWAEDAKTFNGEVGE